MSKPAYEPFQAPPFSPKSSALAAHAYIDTSSFEANIRKAQRVRIRETQAFRESQALVTKVKEELAKKGQL
jgi:hypothetical protein